MDAPTIMWAIGLIVGLFFGGAWGYAAGQRSIVITPLSVETDPLSGVGTETAPD